jgi:hypothetical protein
MKTKPILSPKAAVQLLFKTEDLHPQMGNLGAKEIIKSFNHSRSSAVIAQVPPLWRAPAARQSWKILE